MAAVPVTSGDPPPQGPAPRYFWGEAFATEEEFYASHGVVGTSAYYAPPDDGAARLFVRSWHPASSQARPRALIFMVHGYGNDVSWTFQSTAVFLARSGFSCFAADLPGHGRSPGLRAFVPDVPRALHGLLSFFRCARRIFDSDGSLPCFLFGESMGGALCLLLHLSTPPEEWAGAVLVAPMCKISDRMRPPWPLPELLTLVARFAPTLPVVPTADIMLKSVKVPEKRVIAGANPMRYKGRPRLGTVVELLRVTDVVAESLEKVSIPFLVVHGGADEVTDPDVSRALYNLAASKDKTIKIYDGMLHSLLFGEPDENIARVRADILQWLDQRSPAAMAPASSPPLPSSGLDPEKANSCTD